MKKEQKKEKFPWIKVGIIAFSVVFVVMFVLNYMMTAGTLQYFRGVRVNDSVTIDFTLRDVQGQPVLTSDQNIYRTSLMRGGMPFYAAPLTVQAGYGDNPPVTGVAAQNYYLSRGAEAVRFGVLGDELNGLDMGVLGMKKGEKKTIRFNVTDPLVLRLKNYEFTAMGGNFSTIAVGDMIPLGISETPLVRGMEGSNETPTNTAWRVGTVINKTADSLEVQHLYPSVDITVTVIK